MTHWNYRIVQTETPDGPEWGMYEVYYDDNGKPVSRTADPAEFISDDGPQGVIWAMRTALDTTGKYAVLEDDEIGGLL